MGTGRVDADVIGEDVVGGARDGGGSDVVQGTNVKAGVKVVAAGCALHLVVEGNGAAD